MNPPNTALSSPEPTDPNAPAETGAPPSSRTTSLPYYAGVVSALRSADAELMRLLTIAEQAMSRAGFAVPASVRAGEGSLLYHRTGTSWGLHYREGAETVPLRDCDASQRIACVTALTALNAAILKNTLDLAERATACAHILRVEIEGLRGPTPEPTP